MLLLLLALPALARSFVLLVFTDTLFDCLLHGESALIVRTLFLMASLAGLCWQGNALDVNWISFRVEFYERITSLDPYSFHSCAEVLKLEVGTRLGALVLLVVVVKVDSLVVVQIDHLRIALALPLHSLNIITN